jgi:large repetitive protein
VHTLTFWSKDAAGNVEDRSTTGHSVTIKIDNIAPTITGAPDRAANAYGWYNAPVTVSFQCSDGQTAVASCSPATTLSGNGANQNVFGTATDVAGNSATTSVGPLNIDKTAPAMAAFTGRTQYKIGESMTVPTCQATDSLSGLASCSVQGPTGSGASSPNGAGDYVYISTATDKAGNTSVQSVTLHVGYGFVGFTAPVGTPGHDLGSASAFKAGSTVPMKFGLTNAAGAVVQAAYMPVWVAPVDLGVTSTSAAATVSTAAPTVGGSFKWDATARQYVFTWQTPKTGAGHYYRVGVQLDSGDVYTAVILLT